MSVKVYTQLIVMMSLLGVCCACNEQTTEPPLQNKTATTHKALSIFSPSWSVVAEMKNIGMEVTGSSELYLYKDWVATPQLSNNVIDLGQRFQPNPELLSQLKIDKIIDSEWYVAARSLYGNIPYKAIDYKVSDTAIWQDFEQPTLTMGQEIGKLAEVKRYITKAKHEITALGHTFHKKYPHIKKLAFIQFQDVSTVRMYAKNNLVSLTSAQMNLEHITLGKQNAWGFASVPLAKLTQLDADTCVVIIKPHTTMIQKELANSLIWQRLDYGHSRCITTIEPLWLYGGINSMKNLATSLANADFKGGVALTKEEVAS